MLYSYLHRGSTDAVKLAHQCISSLTKDPTQDLAQLIRRITGSTPATSAQKRYVPPSTDSNTTSVRYDEPLGAPPVTGGFTAPAYTTVSTTPTVTAGAGYPAARPLQKKSSGHIITSMGVVSIAGGSSGVGRASTIVTASNDKTTVESKSTSVSNAVPTSRSSVPGPAVLSHPPSSAPVLIRSSSAGSAALSTATSGAVRKLFVNPTVTQSVKPSAPRVNGPKMMQSRSNSRTALLPEPTTSSAEPALKLTSTQPPPPASTTSKTISYSRIIASQESSRGVSHGEMIEQPVQQIIKTPTIFQEPATQITKPKKISTYSDAVGKKHQSGSPGSINSSSVYTSDGGAAARVVAIGSNYPVTSSTQTQSSQVSKINLAPGSRPMGGGGTANIADSDKVCAW